MKKVLKFLAYPFVTAFAIAVNAALFSLSVEVAVSFMRTVSVIIYLFLGGIVLSKIKDKKIKNFSLLFTTLTLLAGSIACAVIMSDGHDTAVWMSMIIFPFSTTLAFIFQLQQIDILFLLAFVVSSVLPVLISYIASKIFELEKKKLKAALVAVLAIVCIGSAVQGAVSIFSIADNSIYKDGKFYNAYYDVNGNTYESNEDVPYYDKDGNVYYQTYNHPERQYSDGWPLYVGEMTDKNGKEYDIDDFYVYADGYIFRDEGNTVKMREDLSADVMTDWCYVDSQGNICGSILCVSYTSAGEPYFGMGNEYKTE